MVHKIVAGAGIVFMVAGAGLMGGVATLQSFVVVELPGVDKCKDEPLGRIGIFKSSFVPKCVEGTPAMASIGLLAEQLDVPTTDFPLLFPSTTNFANLFSTEGKGPEFKDCKTFYAVGGPAEVEAVRYVITEKVLPSVAAGLKVTYDATAGSIDVGATTLVTQVNGFFQTTAAKTAIPDLAISAASLKGFMSGTVVPLIYGTAFKNNANVGCASDAQLVPIAAAWPAAAETDPCTMGPTMQTARGNMAVGLGYNFSNATKDSSLDSFLPLVKFFAEVLTIDSGRTEATGFNNTVSYGACQNKFGASYNIDSCKTELVVPLIGGLSSILSIVPFHPASSVAVSVGAFVPFGMSFDIGAAKNVVELVAQNSTSELLAYNYSTVQTVTAYFMGALAPYVNTTTDETYLKFASLQALFAVCASPSTTFGTCKNQLPEDVFINSVTPSGFAILLDSLLGLGQGNAASMKSIIQFLNTPAADALVSALTPTVDPEASDALKAEILAQVKLILGAFGLCAAVPESVLKVSAVSCPSVLLDGSALAILKQPKVTGTGVSKAEQSGIPEDWESENYALALLSNLQAGKSFANETNFAQIVRFSLPSATAQEQGVKAALGACVTNNQLTTTKCVAFLTGPAVSSLGAFASAGLTSFIGNASYATGAEASAHRILECEKDLIDAIVFEESQTLVLAAIGITVFAVVLGVGAVASNKLPVGLLSGVVALVGGVLLLVALLHVRNDAPVYALVTTSVEKLPVNGTYFPYYKGGLAQTLALPAVMLPITGGLLMIGSSFCKRAGSEDDQLVSKVDNTY